MESCWAVESRIEKDVLTRLQKYLAECGVASRRKAEELIAAGQVKVNGQVVTKLGTQINPATDLVTVNNQKILKADRPIYLKLNKPRGYVCSTSGQGAPTIFELVKDVPGRLFPIGRLDKDSEGLVLLTNDGELANKLMHPRYEHEKEYIVNVKSFDRAQDKCPMTNEQMKVLSSGITIDGKRTLPAKVKRLGPNSFGIVLREGRKRQIRRMVEAIGHRVMGLKRVRIGDVTLGNLPLGKYERITCDIILKPCR